jgi:HD superfamily phosphohydrolase YqeK
MRIVTENNGKIEEWERRNPLLLHGRAGAILLRRYGMRDNGVCEAVAEHVTGKPGMCRLSKVVFVSDLLEPSRDFIDSELRERVLAWELDDMVKAVLECTIRYLTGREIAVPALELYESLNGNEKEDWTGIRAENKESG